ncbi:MAG: glycosyl transferase family 90 [Rhabdochlamydiaceae bacterium]|nr:glycosyl transferase family 90 [Candidatus Amphrikana amoebophyrae]
MRTVLLFLLLFLTTSPIFAITALQINDKKYRWMDKQISREFAHFHVTGITQDMLNRVCAEKKEHLSRFQVINGKYYGENNACKKVIETLASQVTLPDLDCLYYNSNGPVLASQLPKSKAPILAGFKHKSFKNVILYHPPSFEVCENSVRDWRKVSSKISQINQSSPWEEKMNILVWRGEMNGFGLQYKRDNWQTVNRGRLVALTLAFPELINARFTSINNSNTDDFEYLKNTLPQSEILSFRSQMQHKYQICLPSNCCSSSGTLWKMLSNCLVFIPDSSQEMWYHKKLIPWRHYIPLKADLSDLMKVLHWIQQRDARAKKIALEGSKFAKENLLPDHLYIYCYKVLLQYASHQKFQPKVVQ